MKINSEKSPVKKRLALSGFRHLKYKTYLPDYYLSLYLRENVYTGKIGSEGSC